MLLNFFPLRFFYEIFKVLRPVNYKCGNVDQYNNMALIRKVPYNDQVFERNFFIAVSDE